MRNMKLIHGDCLEELKQLEDESVDMVLTDPPYGMSFVSNYRNDKYKAIENDADLSWVDEMVYQCWRLAKNNTGHYFFCSFHHIDVFKQAIERRFKVKNVLVWEKNNTSMGDLKGDFAPKVEFVIFAHKGRRLINGKRDPNIFGFSRTGNVNHPTEKPVDLCKYLMGKFSDEGETVLDPFMGSGTTGVACACLNRNFVGIEKDDKYFEIAKRRIGESSVLV